MTRTKRTTVSTTRQSDRYQQFEALHDVEWTAVLDVSSNFIYIDWFGELEPIIQTQWTKR